MIVMRDGTSGSIGGGQLEFEAIAIAREMLLSGGSDKSRSFALGPELGQCCGGQARLTFTTGAIEPVHVRPPLWIWGAGHVGRAIAAVIAPLDTRDIVLIDDDADRLPTPLPAGVSPLVAKDMPAAVRHAPSLGDHIILTYSHAIDLALCDALLRHGFDQCGLIGSATKWTRFRKRLGQMGHQAVDIDRITCPIGDPALGKHPQAIAIGVAMAMLRAEQKAKVGDGAG